MKDDMRQALLRVEDKMDRRFEQVDHRFERLEGRFDKLTDRVERQFLWLVGIQITTLVTVVAALLARR